MFLFSVIIALLFSVIITTRARPDGRREWDRDNQRRPAGVHEEAGVRLLVHQHIVGLRRAESMAEDPARTMIAIEHRVEQVQAVRGPDEAVGCARERLAIVREPH